MNPANGLASTTQDAEGDIVDFSGRGLKLDTESDGTSSFELMPSI